MKTQEPRNPRFGYVGRNVFEGDRIYLERDGVELGFIDFKRIPHDVRVSIVLAFDKDIRISRREEER
jgi:hypothetical protein